MTDRLKVPAGPGVEKVRVITGSVPTTDPVTLSR
jgi:hypothetical protein